MLSRISQSQEDKDNMIPLIWGARSSQNYETESRMVVIWDWGQEKMESYCLKIIEFQSGKIKKF